jgi:hypothetical protein
MICTGQMEQAAYKSTTLLNLALGGYDDIKIVGIPLTHNDPINLSAVTYYSQKTY